MTPSLACPLALSSLVLLAACATSSAAPIAADASPLAGIDLGPSSRIPTTRIAMAATGHEAHRTTAAHRTAAAAAGRAQPVPAINNDARATAQSTRSTQPIARSTWTTTRSRYSAGRP
jgi:hypothetical protein